MIKRATVIGQIHSDFVFDAAHTVVELEPVDRH
jgi:hypothetical protein